MARNTFCGSAAHAVNRRGFLGGLAAAGAAVAADMTALNALAAPGVNGALKKTQKRVILLWLAGGASQLETWNPKPGATTGGPFRSIQTDVPGLRISELMPKMAARMKTTCLIRGLNTKNGDHGSAAQTMMRGRRDEAALRYPDLGAVIAREMGRVDSKVPDYVTFYTQTEGRNVAPGDAGFLGARYAPMELTTSNYPEFIKRLDGITDLDHQERGELRDLLGKQFGRGRSSETMNSQNEAYQRVRGIMASEKLFDVTQEPQKIRDRYGSTQFGEQVLIARRLVEAGVPFVRVGRAWWDSHGQNFETHQEMVPELDHVMATLIDDLSERGMLDDVMIVTLSEFGRTPSINSSLGRDHFASAWSSTITGCGIKRGSVYGKTDPKGQAVVSEEADAGSLFATIYSALGLDPDKNYHVGSRPIPLVNPGVHPISAVLG
ncbi:hypothetical protein : Uncultured bacterium genome assembly Metasoil_fosmids_resub OS=uncultured bacterium PE=4 SV=1: DUF1501 [Gemmata massiliana]|uniref:DUF1501 domain-containing protein n=1 Tax=Gemmata massiliana TaxID=1210884 RepID=A0A6P2CSP1_9BACT|nr:DUF1501 domain-containing protein [Gemmata massiliana]VTR91951.1 hypothetical protein : Uncultured bacterium genome assembly Metasoil_fosmids_resub OS=uncultured bacterium PE=4 SV=1: DUF1501 [Gemmata massiliana]